MPMQAPNPWHPLFTGYPYSYYPPVPFGPPSLYSHPNVAPVAPNSGTSPALVPPSAPSFLPLTPEGSRPQQSYSNGYMLPPPPDDYSTPTDPPAPAPKAPDLAPTSPATPMARNDSTHKETTGSALQIEPKREDDGYPNRDIRLELPASDAPRAWPVNKWEWRDNGQHVYTERTQECGHASRRWCLGILQCSGCRQYVRPKTSDAARKSQIGGPCKNSSCTSPNLTHIKCSPRVFTHRFQFDRDGVKILAWVQEGNHSHPRPPGGAHLTETEATELDKQVSRRPNASVHQLRTGDGHDSVPLGQITPILSDPSKAHYKVEKSQERLGIRSKGLKHAFTVFHALDELPHKHGSRVDIQVEVDPTCIFIQTTWMKDSLQRATEAWITEGLDKQ
ncbi:hypothetical protein OF83DRAFT_1189877, partial [Amylostereum chailletii]